MELGYINFSNEEKNNLYRVIQSIREHHAIDELGIGRIRDAFSNEMFPGMSTLQNRAKYFAVLPALYYQAEKGHYNNVREVRRRVLDLEIKLTRQLMNGAETSEERYGITGSTLIEQAERDNSKYVKYDPSYIYWGGLVTYNMVRTDGNIYQLIYERSRHIQESPEHLRKTSPEEYDGDAEGYMGRSQLFNTGGLNYVFDGRTPILVKLNKAEAEFIYSCITKSERSHDSLLAYILNHPDVPILDNYLDLGAVWNELPTELRRVYVLSARFSRFTYLLRIYYNYLYVKKTQDEESAKPFMDDYLKFLSDNRNELTFDKIMEVLAYVEESVIDIPVKQFVAHSAQCVSQGRLDQLEECLVKREKETKGTARAKLTNWKKYVGKPHVGAFFLDYRWGLVYSMINEIREGMRYGQ